jgi:hypothetical protein
VAVVRGEGCGGGGGWRGLWRRWCAARAVAAVVRGEGAAAVVRGEGAAAVVRGEGCGGSGARRGP